MSGAGAGAGAAAGADCVVSDEASARVCIGKFLETREQLAEMTKLASPIRKNNRQRQKALHEWMAKSGKKTCFANGGRTEIALVERKKAFNFKGNLDTNERRQLFLRIIAGLDEVTPAAIASAFNAKLFEEPPVETHVALVCKDSEYGRAMKKLETPTGEGKAEMTAKEKADAALLKMKAAVEAPDAFAA